MLVGANVGGKVDLTNAKIRKNVDLSRAEIRGALDLVQRPKEPWPDRVVLDLSSAKIGLMPGLSGAWPPRLRLDGLTYQGVGQPSNFRDWFQRVPLNHYSPQPYEQLASVVSEQGDKELAKEIRYEGREVEREREYDSSKLRWVGQTLLKVTIGYGYYPSRAVWWVLGLVTMGAIVLYFSGESRRHGLGDGFAYSFDMLLPIIGLREKHKSIDLKSEAPWFARHYFYFHKIMGFLLASFLVAALAGLTQ